MRRPNDPHDRDATEDDGVPFDHDEGQGEPVGVARHVARGGPEDADLDGDITDGEDGPGSD